MPLFPSLHDFYQDYEAPLARAFFAIDHRGLLVDTTKLAELRSDIVAELRSNCDTIANAVGRPTFSSKSDAASQKLFRPKDYFNLGSSQQVIIELQKFGLKIPKSRKTGRESSGEEVLQTLLVETGNPILHNILRVRELNKIKGTYVDAPLLNNILYTNYVVTATVTGRRGSRQNTFGLGSNHQNLPKHSKLGKKFRDCVVARPGKIFVEADQASAEDWVTNAIIFDVSGVDTGWRELHNGVDRHQKLAAFIFSQPLENCSRESPNIFRYLGKKTLHAGQRGMQAVKMASVLISEGLIDSIVGAQDIPSLKMQCTYFLTKFHEANPEVEGVYHKWVQQELLRCQELTSPTGRVRHFYAMRPNSDNSKTFRDGYAQIPQEVVATNTGLAILELEKDPVTAGTVVMDIHDAVVVEVDDNKESIAATCAALARAFDREFVFPNGTRLKIPIELAIGHSLGGIRQMTPDLVSV